MEKKKRYTWLGNYRFLYGNLWKYDKKVIWYSIMEAVMNVAVMFGAAAMPAMVIHMLERQLSLGEILSKIILLFAVYGGVCMGRVYLNGRNEFQFVEFRAVYMMLKLLGKVIQMDYMQYEDQENQKLLAKAQEAFTGGRWGLEGILRDDVVIWTDVAGLFLYSFLISGVSPWIVFLMLVISGIQMAGFYFANRYELHHKDSKAGLKITQNYLDQMAYETASGKDVRLYQMQTWLNGLYKKTNRKYRTLLRKEKTCYFVNDLFGLVLQLLRDAVCYLYLIRMLREGMAVSQFVLYIGVIASFSAYFSELTARITEIGYFQKMVSFLREFLEIEPVFHHGTGERLKPEDQSALEVEFSHVSFSYPSGKEKSKILDDISFRIEKEKSKILDDISFRIEKGERLALVGVNGAGKSTIVKLLCGFYKPDCGHIYINGTDINDLDLDTYHSQLAAVFQNAFAYSCSIAENVSCCVSAEYDRERCINALTRAGLWEKVSQLSKKELTFLNKDMEDDGIALSGGEMQKLLLARALYKGCRLLLLDEPTAALDAISEKEMYEKYQRLADGKTSLFISHRLASTRFCDRILFLENGKIMETGNHGELLALGGRYAHMFEVQSQYYRDGGCSRENPAS